MAFIIIEECDPVAVAACFHKELGFLWLDSADRAHAASRYSYICFAPISTLRHTGSQFECATFNIDQYKPNTIRDWHSGFRGNCIEGGPPFQGGIAGYIGYDFAQIWSALFQSRHRTAAAPLELNLYDTVIAFDHVQNQTWIISSGLSEWGVSADEIIASARVDSVKRQFEQARNSPQAKPVCLTATALTDAEDYVRNVEHVQDYIRAGDIYQANIAHTFAVSCEDGGPPNPFESYLTLRSNSPAPFSGYGVFQDRTIASVSPERLIACSPTGDAHAQPIKGTIRRSDNAEEDALLRAELLGSEKDRAENIMIVDLLRNDLSRVCQPHSVNVPGLCVLESFAGLHHLTSTVIGELRRECDAFDLLKAVFPGGSITGAPKLRAMEIIDTLETGSRGAFCGSLGYIGFDGAMDFNIMIRTIDITCEGWRLKVGAGITLQSDARSELAETHTKIARLARLSTCGSPRK